MAPIAILVFLAIFTVTAIAVVIARLVLDRLQPEAVEPEPVAALSGLLMDDDGPLLLREAEVSSISLWAWLLGRFNVTERLKEALAEADVPWTAGRMSLGMLLCGTVSWAMLHQISWLPAWAVAAMCLLAAHGPYFYVLQRKQKRRDQIEEQMPDALESMARALRAGHPFAGALDAVAQQTPNPLGRELRKVFAEGALGAPWDRALEALAQRMPLPEVCMFVAAVVMQSRSGGNLAEVLDKLSEAMRDGAAVRGEVKSISAQGRFAGYILTALPFGIAAILFVVNPHFILTLTQEETGRTMLAMSFLGLVAAHFIIRKLVDIRL